MEIIKHFRFIFYAEVKFFLVYISYQKFLTFKSNFRTFNFRTLNFRTEKWKFRTNNKSSQNVRKRPKSAKICEK